MENTLFHSHSFESVGPFILLYSNDNSTVLFYFKLHSFPRETKRDGAAEETILSASFPLTVTVHLAVRSCNSTNS
jgi:Zn-dependent oligopeptidase